ncbi:MAG TPA: TetR family transcriptional regulator [Acidimicrobiales bacterium]|nr:TetR family transcriptional regulator [Acidimicrobiales bacterium]
MPAPRSHRSRPRSGSATSRSSDRSSSGGSSPVRSSGGSSSGRSSSGRSSGSVSREEHKELTRQGLLKAALRLLAQNSFDSISLREVTREAGISPTAFYRHFDDMEELGLVLVEDAFASLRGMLRDARSNPDIVNDAIRRSVRVLADHVESHEAHMRFIAREQHGGVRRIRRAIAREIDLVAIELALDLARFPVVSEWAAEDRRLLADLIVEMMVGVAADLVDAESRQHAELVRASERKLRLIVVGVAGWRPLAGPPA